MTEEETEEMGELQLMETTRSDCFDARSEPQNGS
jgi:hypothetical protein